MAMPPHSKSMRPHLYLMEALAAYYQVSGDPVVRQRLIQLIGIQARRAVRDQGWACTKGYEPDWTFKWRRVQSRILRPQFGKCLGINGGVPGCRGGQCAIDAKLLRAI